VVHALPLVGVRLLTRTSLIPYEKRVYLSKLEHSMHQGCIPLRIHFRFPMRKYYRLSCPYQKFVKDFRKIQICCHDLSWIVYCTLWQVTEIVSMSQIFEYPMLSKNSSPSSAWSLAATTMGAGANWTASSVCISMRTPWKCPKCHRHPCKQHNKNQKNKNIKRATPFLIYTYSKWITTFEFRVG